MLHHVHGSKIVIIGSGLGGLSTGILLSLLNFSVTIVEKNDVPGGLIRSYRREGLDCPVGVHYVGALEEGEPLGRMFQILGISPKTLFVPLGEEGIVDRYIFDHFVFDLPRGFEAFEDRLRASFPRDAEPIGIVLKNLEHIIFQMNDISFLLSGQDNPFQNLILYQPMGKLLDHLHASARLRALLTVPCELIGVPIDDCPVIFHHMVLAGYLASAWRLKEGGAKMAEAFVNRFKELGGHLVLRDGVQKIVVQNGRVRGVVLASGHFLSADAVVSAIHPKIMLDLLEENTLPVKYRRRIRTLRETEGVIGVQVEIKESASVKIPHNVYRLYSDENGRIQSGCFYQVSGGNLSRRLLSILTKSLYADWRTWENTRSGNRGTDYVRKKTEVANQLLKKARELFGDLPTARILDVFTPLTLRDYVGAPEGGCYGVMRSSNQWLRITSLNRLPVDGLYLAGQNAVAPGVMGCLLGSFQVARQIMGQKNFVRVLSELQG